MWFWSGSNKAVIDSKRAERETLLASAPTLDVNVHGVYLRATAAEIVKRIQDGEWTASEVLEAYIAATGFAQATTNCVTEVLFKQARIEAEELDREFAATGKVRGPLHGVPISFKDQYNIAGYDTTIGFTTWAQKPATEDAQLVTTFRASGAIPFIKTNVPQTMFAFECANPLWGCTTNPWNSAYTCGGSSGGEAALLAMDGSAMGVGSDVGGSLRIPAAYCGVYSLKPSVGRFSSFGARAPVPGTEGVRTSKGPMARSVADLDLACRIAFGIQSPDLETVPVPYRDIELPKKLKFGYYTDDGYIKASPACRRAVLETVEALEREGHECVEIELPNVARAFEIFVGLSSSDGYKSLTEHISPDPQENALFLVTIAPRLNWILRGMLTWVFEHVLGDRNFANGLRNARVKPVHEYFRYSQHRADYARAWNKQMWMDTQFDGLIGPVQALPQLRHGGCATMSLLSVSTGLYNVVDCSVGCIPVTRVDPAKDQLTSEWTTKSNYSTPMMEKALYTDKVPFYDAEAMKGMPIGIQVIGRKWEDEKVLGMMGVVDRALGGKKRGFGPGMWHDK